MKAKYPKFTREQSKACKLSDRQIEDIPRLLKRGETRSEIAKKYGVTFPCINYWCMSPEERKERNKKSHLKWGKIQTKEEHSAYSTDIYRRKRKMMPKEIRKYAGQINKAYKERDIENFRILRRATEKRYNRKDGYKRKTKIVKAWRGRNREKYNAYMREYKKKWRAERRKKGLPPL